MSAPLPEIEPEVLIKKIRVKSAGGGHGGGAWKVAYADFVTAMMAFFMLMWLLGATDEDQRKGIADYFAPTVMQSAKSGGSNGIMAGRSLQEPDGVAPHEQRTNIQSLSPFQNSKAGDRKNDLELQKVEAEIRDRIRNNAGLNSLDGQLRFIQTPEGLRIEMLDKADYSMFTSGTADMDRRATELLSVVADVISPLPNKLAVRGHTDSQPYGNEDGNVNNWTLSLDRAEITRRVLAASGIDEARFSRLEGVADTQPLYPENTLDPRNRRMSVTLLRL